jgi:N-acetylneuraminic acid mutarotase
MSAVLPDGSLLLAGGVEYAQSVSSATTQIFNVATNRWETVGSLNVARCCGGSYVFADGRVMVYGGLQGWFGSPQQMLTSAEIYDPNVLSWTLSTNSMVQSRWLPTSVSLGTSGKLLIFGGTTEPWGNGEVLQSAEVFDPTTETWSATGSMQATQVGPFAALLPTNGKVLAAGGNGWSSLAVPIATSELYDPTSGTWSLTGSMLIARSFASSIVLPGTGQVLIADGWPYVSNSITSEAELYDPTSGTWATTGSLIPARYNYSLEPGASSGTAVAFGGSTSNVDQPFQPTASTQVYEEVTGTWMSVGNMTIPRWQAAVVALPDGRIVALGGTDANGNVLGSAEVYGQSNYPLPAAYLPVVMASP